LIVYNAKQINKKTAHDSITTTIKERIMATMKGGIQKQEITTPK